MTSPAEERLRLKAEAMLRRRHPDARIIHELVLAQGDARIDLAAVTPDLVVLAEIKSEKDVLTRLPHQAEMADRVGDDFLVVTVERHAEEIERLGKSKSNDLVDVVRKGVVIGQSYVKNPDFIPALRGLQLFVEDGEGLLRRDRYGARLVTARLVNPAARLRMLWAAELQHIAAPLGAGPRWNREACVWAICEHMTGGEIRRAVCARLRARAFPRADAPIFSPRAPTMIEGLAA